MPSRASPVRKRVQAQFVECKNMCKDLFIDHRAPRFTMLTKCQTCAKTCLWNAPVPFLRCWPDEMIRVLSFLLLRKVQSTLALVFQMPPYVGYAATLGLRLLFAFASLSCPSMLSFHFGKTTDSQLLSCVLVPANILTQLWWGCIWPSLWFWRCRA
jgi:hypothetical protein